MRFERPGDVFLADCPARLTLDVIADKWSLVILHALGARRWRHGELRELIGGISSKVLTQTLRKLERYGLVERHEFTEVPRRVEYELTELGRTLLAPIDALTEWAETYGATVIERMEERETGSLGLPSAPVALLRAVQVFSATAMRGRRARWLAPRR